MKSLHYTVSARGRSSGTSSVASAAYRSRSLIYDERRGVSYDFSDRCDLVDSFIMAPEWAPAWVSDRQVLWNEVEKKENRVNSQLFRSVEFAIPATFDRDRMISVVKDHVKGDFVSRGMVADVSIHDGAGENPHAHVMLTLRDISKDGFLLKNRSWNEHSNVQDWRESFSNKCNVELSTMGMDDMHISPYSFKRRGIEKEPEKHRGYSRSSQSGPGKTDERDLEEGLALMAQQRLKMEMEELQHQIDSRMASRRMQRQRRLLGSLDFGHNAFLQNGIPVKSESAVQIHAGGINLTGLADRLKVINIEGGPPQMGSEKSPEPY